MPSAELWTSQPTYGIPDSSSRPWIAPSSPSLPCRTGTTTSRLIVSYFPLIEDEQSAHAAVRGQRGGLVCAALPVRGGALAEFPGAVARDPDEVRLVLVRVE